MKIQEIKIIINRKKEYITLDLTQLLEYAIWNLNKVAMDNTKDFELSTDVFSSIYVNYSGIYIRYSGLKISYNITIPHIAIMMNEIKDVKKAKIFIKTDDTPEYIELSEFLTLLKTIYTFNSYKGTSNESKWITIDKINDWEIKFEYTKEYNDDKLNFWGITITRWA